MWELYSSAYLDDKTSAWHLFEFDPKTTLKYSSQCVFVFSSEGSYSLKQDQTHTSLSLSPCWQQVCVIDL